jgi:hypothetical protein
MTRSIFKTSAKRNNSKKKKFLAHKSLTKILTEREEERKISLKCVKPEV